MKRRMGFVTNSSSSNFIVALRKENRPLLAVDVFDVFGVKLDSPLTKQLGRETFDFVESAELLEEKNFKESPDWFGGEVAFDKALEFMNKGWKVYHVYIDMNKIPMFLCLPEQSETETIVLWSLDAYRSGAYED